MMKFFKRTLSTDSFTNLIAAGTEINGAVNFTGVIQVEGTVKGDILRNAVEPGAKSKNNSDVIHVTKTGNVSSALLSANCIVIAGEVTSKKIWAEDTLRISSTAKVFGATLYYRRLEIEPGANIHDCILKNIDGEAVEVLPEPWTGYPARADGIELKP
jgi:cytoskeletal protein CcmA (bactofilin family)